MMSRFATSSPFRTCELVLVHLGKQAVAEVGPGVILDAAAQANARRLGAKGIIAQFDAGNSSMICKSVCLDGENENHHEIPSHIPAVRFTTICSTSARNRTRTPWRRRKKSTSPSSASASAPSSFRSTSAIPMPTCMPSASAPEEAERGRRRLQGREALHELRGRAQGSRTSISSTSTRPIPDHGWQSIAALKAGKHVMCTVPMATTVAECKQIVELVKKTGLKYMMAETVVYAREYLFMKEMYRQGRTRQDPVRAGQPSAGHGRLAELLAGPAADVVRHALRRPLPGADAGAGGIRVVLRLGHDPQGTDPEIQLALRRRDRATSSSPTRTSAARIIRSLFDTARQYRESIDVYGSKKTFEWPLIEGEEPVLHTAKKPEPKIPKQVKVPDYAQRLPKAIQQFTTQGRLRCRREAASVVHAGRRPRRLASAPGPRIRHGAGRRPRSISQRGAIGELDLRRHPAHESALKGGEVDATAEVHADVRAPSLGERPWRASMVRYRWLRNTGRLGGTY